MAEDDTSGNCAADMRKPAPEGYPAAWYEQAAECATLYGCGTCPLLGLRCAVSA